MNPDKLFDYLDGNLSSAERAEVETKLATDSQLQQQLAIAREIHRGMRGSRERREVIPPIDDPAVAARGARVSHRVGAACAALVLLNVLIGLTVISVKNRKSTKSGSREAAIRQQLAASLDAAAQSALPLPTFASSEVQLSAPRSEWESATAKIIAAAETCSGSGVKGLPEENAAVVVVDIPATRESEFRTLISAPVATASQVKEGDRTIVQIRIAEAVR